MATCDLYECFNNRAHADWIVPPSLTTQYAVSARFSWIVEGSSSLHTGQPQRSKDDQKQRVSKCHQPIDRYMYHGSIGSWSQIYIDLLDVIDNAGLLHIQIRSGIGKARGSRCQEVSLAVAKGNAIRPNKNGRVMHVLHRRKYHGTLTIPKKKIMNDHGSTLKDHPFFQLVVSVTGLRRFLLRFQLGSHGFTSRHEHLACGQTASFRAWMLIKKMRFVGVTMGDHPGYSSIFQLLR